MRSHYRRARGPRSLGLQIRQTDRLAKGFCGRATTPKVARDDPAAQAAMNAWLLCVVTAAILSIPVLGPIWPTLAVGGGIWMASRSARRRR